MSEDRQQVPASACRFAGGEVKFAATMEGKTPIRMLARSAQPIEHPWWGRVVHDMSGVKHKKTIPIDYEHYEPIGYLDKFEASNDGLYVEGALVETGQPNDRVKSLVALSGGGVPYEASIYFGGDGIKTEWLAEGGVAEVNGYTFEGPGVIIREWPCRGVAVCPYGADMHTESKFTRADESFSITPFKEADMPIDPKTGKPATKLSDAPAVETAPATTPTETPAAAPVAEEKPAEVKPVVEEAPAAALSEVRAEAKKFREYFGDKGAVWFSEGLTFEEARVRQTKELSATVEKLETENKELKTKLAAASQNGELSAVGADVEGDKKKRGGFSSKIRIVGAAPKS